MKDWLGSRKVLSGLAGIITMVLTTYWLKDNAELAETIAYCVTAVASLLVGSQGAADAWGGDEYHKNRKKKK